MLSLEGARSLIQWYPSYPLHLLEFTPNTRKERRLRTHRKRMASNAYWWRQVTAEPCQTVSELTLLASAASGITIQRLKVTAPVESSHLLFSTTTVLSRFVVEAARCKSRPRPWRITVFMIRNWSRSSRPHCWLAVCPQVCIYDCILFFWFRGLYGVCTSGFAPRHAARQERGRV